MKKSIFLCTVALALVALTACSSNKDEEEPKQEQSIIGSWSLGDPNEGDIAISIHFNFKKDGTFDLFIPHWEEGRYGTYTVSGNTVSFKVTKLEWLWDRKNGYVNVYDQWECYYKGSISDENREKFEDPHAEWERKYPDECKFSAVFSFKDGALIMSLKDGYCPGLDGDNESFYSHPNYVPKEEMYN